jgi:serine/threonine protein kinase
VQEVYVTLPRGSVVRNRYVIVDLLGQGGSGAVYLVRDQRVKGNLFALKEIINSNKKDRSRFLFEAEVLKRLEHTALPRVYTVFDDDAHQRAYSGDVTVKQHIEFTVQSYHGNGPLFFYGWVNADGSLSGSYCSLDASGHCNANAGASGVWQVSVCSASAKMSSFALPLGKLGNR